MLRGPRRTVQAPHPELAEVQVELFCTVGRLSTSVRNRGSYQGHSVVDFPAVKWLNPLKVQVRPLLPDQTAFLGFEVPQKNTCIPAISKVVQWLWSSLARTRLPRFELSSQFLQGTHFAIQGLGASHRNTDSQTSDILLYLSKVSKVHRMVVVEPAGKRFQHGSASTLCQAIAEALKINRSLTTIKLDDNNIGVPGAEAWRRAGRTCGGRI